MSWVLAFLWEALAACGLLAFKVIIGSPVSEGLLALLLLALLLKVAAGYQVRAKRRAAGILLGAVVALDALSAGVLYLSDQGGWEFMPVVLLQVSGSRILLLIAGLANRARARPPLGP